MASVASKNRFDLLGNDIDSEGDIKTLPKLVVKQPTTTKKKDVDPEAPPPTAGRGRGERRQRQSNTIESAFRDSNGGREGNRARGTDEQGNPLPPRGRGGRGGGGGRGRGRQYDRHSATDRVDSEKQVNQGWGSTENEWGDEKAGEAIAQAEANDENVPITTAVEAPAEPDWGGDWGNDEKTAPPVPEEPEEEKVKTYDDFLAEKAAKQAALGALPAARQPNEGSRTNATPLKKGEDEEEVLFAGKEAKAKREKERKQKHIVEIDQRFQEIPRGGRGDRSGRSRGGGDRSEKRGGPRGPPRDGGFRDGGNRDGGYRDGGFRGSNRSGNSAPEITDPNAFPTLGGA